MATWDLIKATKTLSCMIRCRAVSIYRDTIIYCLACFNCTAFLLKTVPFCLFGRTPIVPRLTWDEPWEMVTSEVIQIRNSFQKSQRLGFESKSWFVSNIMLIHWIFETIVLQLLCCGVVIIPHGIKRNEYHINKLRCIINPPWSPIYPKQAPFQEAVAFNRIQDGFSFEYKVRWWAHRVASWRPQRR